ncbi:hypothetical protein KXW36_009782, partial [Aspergillus fumigatus]
WVLRRRFSAGVRAGILLVLRVMASIISMVEFAKDAIAFGNPCFSELPADRVQVRMAEKIGIAIPAGLPDRPVPGGDGEVGAGETRAFGSQHRIRATLVAKAGSRFDAIDAIAPVADPKVEVGLFHQEADISLDIAVACAPAELRASGDHASTLAGERRRRQHLFQGGAGFFLRMPVGQIVEREVGSDIAAIGHGPGHMTEVRLKRMQACTVAFADKARE